MMRRSWMPIPVLSVLTLMTACGELPARNVGAVTPVPHTRPAAVVVQTARLQIGAPYHYGGKTPAGFDCSGLVQYAYAQAGIVIPRSTEGQLQAARSVLMSHVRPGDVLFFRTSPPKVSHVGIYVGNGRFVHAPSRGKRVTQASLSNPYWHRHVVGAGRFY